MKNFLAIPGVSSPTNEKYIDVYGLLEEEAIQRDYEFQVLHLPGQAETEGTYNFENCAEAICKKLTTLENNDNSFLLMALSSGCPLLLSALARLKKKEITLPAIKNIVLYAPSPCDLYWKLHAEEDGMKGIGAGTRVTADSFKYWEPFEYLLPRTTYPVTVVAGSRDNYVPLFFLDHLKNLCVKSGNANLVKFVAIDNCAHNVRRIDDNNWQDYIKTIFTESV
jgi:hypothetical protein